MNYEFIQALDKAKTFDNATRIEAVKKLYVMCECVGVPDMGGIGKCMGNLPTGVSMEKVDDHCVIFSCSNGSVRLTMVSPNSVLVEASPTGTIEMFRAVGNVTIDTSLVDALMVGMEALSDDALMESWLGDMGKKFGKGLATAALAASAATGVGCAGNAAHMPIDNNAITAEFGIDTTKAVDDKMIPELVKHMSEELRYEAGNQEDGNYSVATTKAAEKAKLIYKMLEEGDIQVRNMAPEKFGQEQAQKNAAEAFARGLDKELRTSMKLDGADFLKTEVN